MTWDDLEGDSFVLEGDDLLSHSKTKESPSTSSSCHSNLSVREVQIIITPDQSFIQVRTMLLYDGQ